MVAEREEVKKVAESRIDTSTLESNALLSMITSGLAIVAGVFTSLNTVPGKEAFYTFLGTMFILAAIIESLGTLKVFKANFTLMSKLVLESIIGLIFLLGGSLMEPATSILIFVLYLSLFIFGNVVLSQELYPLPGWLLSLLIGIGGAFLIGFVVFMASQYSVYQILATALGTTLMLDGILFGYISIVAFRKGYKKCIDCFSNNREEEK
ncbi:MAG: hypothetical protein ABGW77_02565 [Campylobacterales bacterium]|jgi:hypothetical protein